MRIAGMSQGQIIAAISAAALVVSLFLAWGGASVDVPELPEGVPVPPEVEAAQDAAELTGWESQNTLDIYLAITAGLVLAGVLMSLAGTPGGLPFAPAAATFLLGVVGTILTAYVLIDIPEDAERKIGLYLAMAAIVGVAVGSYLQMQKEIAEDY